MNVTLTGEETSLTVTFIGTYQQGTVTKTITEDVQVVVTMMYENFESGGEAYLKDDDAVGIEYWAEFQPNADDPHRENYNFTVDALIGLWYDTDGSLLETFNVTEDLSTINWEYDADLGIYRFTYTGTTAYQAGAAALKIQLNIIDTTTGTGYYTTSDNIFY